jgi:hypothetical protein
MPATKIITPAKAQVKPYEAGNWNAKDANDHSEAINDHADQLDKLLDSDGLVLPSALPAFSQQDADTILALLRTQLDKQYVPVPQQRTPPPSYAQTLSASKTQVAGIVVSFPGPQTLEVTPIPGVSGGLVTLQLLDTSDGNSVTTADVLSGYAAADAFYKFHKKNGDTHEAQWPATDTTLAV